MDVNILRLPAIVFNEGPFEVMWDAKSLGIATRLVVKGRWYEGCTAVDSNGDAYHIKDAVAARKAGFSWPSLMFDPLVVIDFQSEGEPRRLTPDEVRGLVFRARQAWRYVQGADDSDDIRKRVRAATTVGEIIEIPGEKYRPEK